MKRLSCIENDRCLKLNASVGKCRKKEDTMKFARAIEVVLYIGRCLPNDEENIKF